MHKIVAVRFGNSSNLYNYKTDLPLKEGDFCIVDSYNSIGIVKVVNANVTDDHGIKIATRWVLMAVDIDEARKRVAEYE